MKPLKIAVCEDDSAEYDKLSAILEKSVFPVETEHFSDGSGLLEAYYHGRYDLLLIDIYMNHINGVETVAKIRETDNNVPIAFITTSLDHAMDGYRYHVDRYITKPLRSGDVMEVISRAVQQRENAPAVNVPYGGKVHRIPLSRIRYIESQADMVYLYLTGGGIEKTTLKLKELAVSLPQPPFFVCHKSYAVNLEYVASYDKSLNIFDMKEGGRVYIRRESKAEAVNIYREYMFNLARNQGVKLC